MAGTTDTEYQLWRDAVVQNHGSAWFEWQRAVQIDNINALVEAAEKKWKHDAASYFAALGHIYGVYSEMLADSIANGDCISVISPSEIQDILREIQ